MTYEQSLALEQEQKARQMDYGGDSEEGDVEQGIAAVQVLEALNRYGLEFVQSLIEEWQKPKLATCDWCVHFRQGARGGLCAKKPYKEFADNCTLTLLQPVSPTDRACPLFEDIGF